MQEDRCIISFFLAGGGGGEGTNAHAYLNGQAQLVPQVLSHRVQHTVDLSFSGKSGFPSIRTNLSPFTKDFRGGEQLNESID